MPAPQFYHRRSSTREPPCLSPYDQLEPDTLTRLIEDFVTREALTTATKRPLQTRVLRV
ncbi:hypothetical protein F2S71_08025, partial [Pseudomonas syringae pv. actinidiae]|nr:hypothetical protein [Pseudomonas syringae pv. actinidiae]